MKLILGNKNYSSWSLRPWLLLSANQIRFEEVVVPLFKPDSKARIAEYSQAGKVPVLVDGETTIWDSLAICEYISDRYLNGDGWPSDPLIRAEARACSAEMHSGFFAIRNNLPMNFRASNRRVDFSDEILNEVQRVDDLWTHYRNQHRSNGPWLFGQFCIADCMYAPMVSRFQTYGVGVSDTSHEYMQTVLCHPSIKQWQSDSQSENDVIEESEKG